MADYPHYVCGDCLLVVLRDKGFKQLTVYPIPNGITTPQEPQKCGCGAKLEFYIRR